jgi:hypothetical protein
MCPPQNPTLSLCVRHKTLSYHCVSATKPYPITVCPPQNPILSLCVRHKTLPYHYVSATKPTWAILVLNPNLRDKKPVGSL